MPAGAGAYVFTGNDAQLDSSAGDKEIAADAAAFVLTIAAATLTLAEFMPYGPPHPIPRLPPRPSRQLIHDLVGSMEHHRETFDIVGRLEHGRGRDSNP
jgi:hypothetical protein